MMDYPIPEMRCAYFPCLGVVDCKSSEWVRPVSAGHQFPLQFVEIVLEVFLKFNHIGFVGFSCSCPLKRQKQVLVRAQDSE